jgi:hypothetical protein
VRIGRFTLTEAHDAVGWGVRGLPYWRWARVLHGDRVADFDISTTESCNGGASAFGRQVFQRRKTDVCDHGREMRSYVKVRIEAGATAIVKDVMERGWSKLRCNSWRSTTAGREGVVSSQRGREREHELREDIYSSPGPQVG